MATFPQEITTEILCRLPVKSLLRFTSVCKEWKSLIKNPNFTKLHLNQTLASNSDWHLIICERSLYIAEFQLEAIHNPLICSELHYPLKPDDVLILGSCNGILCVSDYHRNNVFLYNPLTNWHRKVRVNHLIFKIMNEHVIYGFGYDNVTDDYKIFSLYQTFNDHNWVIIYREAQVFSFKSNSWKSVKCIPDLDCFQTYRGVYLNNAIYYIVHIMKSFMIFKFIAKFDFRTDTLLRVECPNYGDKFKYSLMLDLSALNGCLCMLVSYFPDGAFPQTQMGEKNCPLNGADFWMMKECSEESWVRLFSIRDPNSMGIEHMISTLVFSRDGRKILLEVDLSKHGWYDLENGTFERITTLGQPDDLVCSACCTLGSLVSIDEKLHSEGGNSGTMLKKKEKRDLDKFLSVGFKLKL